MGKTRTQQARERRQKALAQEVLDRELKKRDEQLPDTIPDSALFADDEDQTPKKKRKITVSSRPEMDSKPQPVKVEYEDLWAGSGSTTSSKQKKRRILQLPKTSEAYNSKELVKPKPQEAPSVIDPADIVPIDNSDDEMRDVLVDKDIPKISIEEDITPPPPKAKVIKTQPSITPIPRYLPLDKKAEIRAKNAESRKQIREMREMSLTPDYEATKAELEEISKPKAGMGRKMERNDPIKRFIPDDPDLVSAGNVQTLGDVQPDQHPFKRIQNNLEANRIIGLH